VQPVLITIAQILRETAQELEHLGAQLCADPAIVAGHCHALQAVDVMVQRHTGLAVVLEGQCEQEEIERMTLEALRDRLRLPNGFAELAPVAEDDGEWWSIGEEPLLPLGGVGENAKDGIAHPQGVVAS